MATVVPGILTIISFSVINVVYARRYAKIENTAAIEGQVANGKPKASRALLEAIPALLLPVIILGGIYGGFSPPRRPLPSALCWPCFWARWSTAS